MEKEFDEKLFKISLILVLWDEEKGLEKDRAIAYAIFVYKYLESLPEERKKELKELI